MYVFTRNAPRDTSACFLDKFIFLIDWPLLNNQFLMMFMTFPFFVWLSTFLLYFVRKGSLWKKKDVWREKNGLHSNFTYHSPEKFVFTVKKPVGLFKLFEFSCSCILWKEKHREHKLRKHKYIYYRWDTSQAELYDNFLFYWGTLLSAGWSRSDRKDTLIS